MISLKKRPERDRALSARPEHCGAPHCVRDAHPVWQQHEDRDGKAWCSGEAPR